MDGTWLATAVGDVDGDSRADLIGLRSDGQVRVSRYPTGDGSQTNYTIGSLATPQDWAYFNFGFDDDLLLD
jgi:hypothetical protein